MPLALDPGNPKIKRAEVKGLSRAEKNFFQKRIYRKAIPIMMYPLPVEALRNERARV